MINKKFSGFSLIELSIVVLIIGVLIAGVTQGSRLVTQSRLNTARNLTATSPVSSIPDLFLWFETTLPNSVISATNGADVENGDNVSGWNNNNVQAPDSYQLYQGTNGNQPNYTTNAIGGLPGLSFNGGTNYMQLNSIFFPVANYTMFVVFNISNVSGQRTILNISNGVLQGLLLENKSGGQFRFLHRFPYASGGGDDNSSSTGAIIANHNYYSTAVRNLNAGTAIVRLNGNQVINGTATLSPFDNSSLTLIVGALTAGSRSFSGYLSEIIIFKRALKNTEISDVESYLAKKWSIYN